MCQHAFKNASCLTSVNPAPSPQERAQSMTQGYSVVPNMPGNNSKGDQKLGAALRLQAESESQSLQM